MKDWDEMKWKPYKKIKWTKLKYNTTNYKIKHKSEKYIKKGQKGWNLFETKQIRMKKWKAIKLGKRDQN